MLTGFTCESNANAVILILGSMPGTVSLNRGEYYGHKRNVFWRIMNDLLDIPVDAAYADRMRLLRQQKIALWDVINRCEREGSLDASIVTTTVTPNNFVQLFARQQQIKTVLFNGGRAELEYRRHVLKAVLNQFPDIEYHRLPSTSPANAGTTYAGKLESWSIITKILDQANR